MPRTKKKVKSIVKTKVISARVTEVVHELLHRQAEDAGMTLSEFTAQMLMKGRVNTSYVFYVHPDEIEAITREFAAIGNNLNQRQHSCPYRNQQFAKTGCAPAALHGATH